MYLSYYGFKDEPFRLTPDPRYLHLSEPHQAALTAVLEGIFYRKGLVMLTGPIGTGKTTLVHAALQIIADRKMPVRSALLFNPVLSRDEFLEMMLDEFEIHCSFTSKPRRLAALHQMLLDTQRTGGTAVLFIDEAHLLSSELLEEIRLLGNADSREGKLLQIVLSGQPELLTVMLRTELSALRQRIAARANLRPLSMPETKAYVAERLHAAGLQGNTPFPDGIVEAMYSFSGGVPRLINLVADGSLALAFRKEQNPISRETVDEAVISLGLKTPALARTARKMVRAPIWQAKSGPAAVAEDGAMCDSRREHEGAAREVIPLQVEQILGKNSTPDVAEVAMQKTAIDRLIEAMKKTRAAARGARTYEQIL